MGLYLDTVPFVADLPPIEQIAAWRPFGGTWEFRLLAVGIVSHVLDVQEGRIVVMSELSWEWEPLTLLDTVPVEHRPRKGAIEVPWCRFYFMIGQPCPAFLADARASSKPPPRIRDHRYDSPRLPRLTGKAR